MTERATERDADGWTYEGLAKRLTLMAKHGDHLTVGERNACDAAARRLRSPGDRGGDVFPGSCPKCGGKASDSGVGTYVCDDGCGWWIKHEDWSLTTHIRVSEPVLKAASTDAPSEERTCPRCGETGVGAHTCRTPTDEAPERGEVSDELLSRTCQMVAANFSLMLDGRWPVPEGWGREAMIEARDRLEVAARRLRRSPRGGE